MDCFEACCLACLKETSKLEESPDLTCIFAGLVEEDISVLFNLNQVKFCDPCRTVLEGILEFKILCQVSKALLQDRIKQIQAHGRTGSLKTSSKIKGVQEYDRPGPLKTTLEIDGVIKIEDDSDSTLTEVPATPTDFDVVDFEMEETGIEPEDFQNQEVPKEDCDGDTSEPEEKFSPEVRVAKSTESLKEKKIKKANLRALSLVKGLPHTCAHCGREVVGRTDIKYHVIKYHLGGIRCPLKGCRAAFFTQDEIEKHLVYHVKKKEQFAARAIKCHTCGLTTTMSDRKNFCEHLLSRHKQSRCPPMPCHLCGKLSKNKSVLKEHLRTVHGSYVFGCEQCGARFKGRENLRIHMTSVHGPKLECSICGLLVAGVRSLKTHINSVHFNKRPFVCKECGADFHTSTVLRKHLHLHNNTRPWNCHICEQGYYSTIYLKRHYLRDHELDYTLEEVRQCAVRISHAYK